MPSYLLESLYQLPGMNPSRRAALQPTSGHTGQVRSGNITRTSSAISINASGANLAALPSRRRASASSERSLPLPAEI